MTVAALSRGGVRRDMPASTALPLSQQLLAWILQSMGLIDELSKVSRSTVKNALRGELVWQAWDGLVEEASRALNLDLNEEQRLQVRSTLRGIDGRIAALDDLGLEPEDLLPAVLKLLIPQVGVRLGTLAVMVEGGLWAEARATCPQLAEWLCDPLNPRTFGRFLEGLLLRYQPGWETWTERKEQLAVQRIAAKRSVERWRSASALDVPNVGNIVALAGIMGDGRQQRAALALLRLGRLLAVARKSLARWIGEAQADEVEAAVRSWAVRTRQVLGSPQFVCEFGELLGTGLRENHEAARVFVAAREVYWGRLLDGVEPDVVGDRLLQESRALRQGEEGGLLKGLVADQLLMPNPVVITAVGQRLGLENILPILTADPLELIQLQWRLAKATSCIAQGQSFSWQTSSTKTLQLSSPSDALREQARRIRAHLRVIVRRSDDEPLGQVELLRFWISFAAEAGGVDAVNHVTSAWNDSVQSWPLPEAFEPMLDDAAVAGHPHLAPLRAARLAQAGDYRAAVLWLGRWVHGASFASGAERRAAADTMLALAHHVLDQVSGVIDILYWEEPDEVEAAAAMSETIAVARQATEEAVLLADQLLKPTRMVLRELEAQERLADLLLLAIRLDMLDAALAAEPEIALVRSGELAEEVEQVLRDHPTHPGCWAGLVLWQELTDQDTTFALKQAQHFGAEAVYEQMRARLVADGLLDP